MPARLSAALLCFRGEPGSLEALLLHPGGPYFARRDLGIWTLPKGEVEAGEDLLAAARREFAEEVGCRPPEGAPIALGEVRQRNNKRVVAFALRSDGEVDFVSSNEFEIEWPPRSGQLRRFPEADRGGWYSFEAAREMLIEAQVAFLDRLAAELG